MTDTTLVYPDTTSCYGISAPIVSCNDVPVVVTDTGVNKSYVVDDSLMHIAYALKILCEIGYITSLEAQALYNGISKDDYCSTDVEGRLITLIDKSIYSWSYKCYELDLDVELSMLIQLGPTAFNVMLDGECIVVNELFPEYKLNHTNYYKGD